MILASLDNAEEFGLGCHWSVVLAWLRRLPAEVALGEHAIVERAVYAIVQEAAARRYDEAFFEAHQTYADVHVVLRGSEGIAVARTADLALRTPYDAAREVAWYERPAGEATRVVLRPGLFVFLGPQDAHLPLLRADHATLRKVVVKMAWPNSPPIPLSSYEERGS